MNVTELKWGNVLSMWEGHMETQWKVHLCHFWGILSLAGDREIKEVRKCTTWSDKGCPQCMEGTSNAPSTTWSWNISQSSQVLASWPGTELPMFFLILKITGGGGRAPIAPIQLDGAGRTCMTNTLGQSTNQRVILRGIKGRLWGQVGEVEKWREKQEWEWK